MTAELTTVIGQLNIADGTWQNSAPNQIAVREPKSPHNPGAGKGDLFILTEVLGDLPNLSSLEQKLAEIVRDTYYMARGSVTASLRRAIQKASDHLYQRNAKVTVEERVVGGVVALVVTQEDVFVAQAGPTAFFAVSGQAIERYPARSVWLDEGNGSHEEGDDLALGVSTFVEPNLYHIQINPHDMLLLADSDLVSEVSPQAVVTAATLQNIRATIRNLGEAARHRNCSALALTVVEAQSSVINGLKMAAPAQLQKLLPTSHPPATETPPPMSAPTAAVPTPMEQVTSIAQRMSGIFTRQPDDYARQQSETASRPTTSSVGVMASATPDPAFEPQFRKADSSFSTSASTVANNVGAAALMAIAASASGLKSLLSSTAREGATPQPRQAGRQAAPSSAESLFSWQTFIIAAIAIPIIASAVLAITYLRSARLEETEYTNLVTAARNIITQAEGAETSSALMLMGEAEALLLQAEEIKPDQTEVIELRSQIAAETDEISNVQRLFNLPHLRSYTDPGTQLKSIVVQGVEMYILDVGMGRIYHHRIDQGGEGLLPDDETLLLVQQGQAVGNGVVAPLTDIVWMPAGGNRQTSDLLALTDTALLEYNPNWGLTISTMSGLDQLVNPVSVSSFFGNFYLLDPASNRILRYLPTLDGYSAPPENYFPPDQPVDLTRAVDMAIDGFIYVLYQDGRISQFSSGRPTDFTLTGLDKPLKVPSSIFTAPDEDVQYIYVADAGNQRIVQLDKNGNFIRQFKPSVGGAITFANLQDIYVDEIGGRMYILDSNNLYLATLPN